MGLRDLDRSLTLQVPARTADGRGGFTLDWTAPSSTLVRCRVAEANQYERDIAGRQEGMFTHYVWMHRRQPLDRGDRLLFADGSFLEIVAVWREDVPGGLLKARAWQRQKGP